MNIVEVIIRTKDDEARAGMKAFEDEAKSSGDRSGKGFSASFGRAMGTIGKGAGGLAGLSGALSMASPLGAAGAALGAFAALAVPELTKVQTAMSKTGAAGQKAWKALSPQEQGLGNAMKQVTTAFHTLQGAILPVLTSVVGMGGKILSSAAPALGVLAKAGGTVVINLLKPLESFVKSTSFNALIGQFAKFAVQVSALAGPQIVNLLKQLMILFVQLMPSGVQILQVLLPLIVQMVTDLTPTIVVLAQVVAVTLAWLQHNQLLIPALALLGVTLVIVLTAIEATSAPIWLIVAAIAAVVVGIVEFAKHWKQIWAEVKRLVGDAVNWIKGHWQLIVEILTGPLGIAIVWIVNHFNQITSVVGRVVGGIGRGFSSVYHAIVDPVWNAVQTVFNYFNQILNFAASIPSRVGHFLGNLGSSALHMIGFEHGGIVGAAASGGARGGLTMVGEHGRELVRLPTGSQVHSNPDTERMMGQGGGGGQPTVISFDFGGAGSDELIKVLRGAIRVKGGNVQTVLGH